MSIRHEMFQFKRKLLILLKINLKINTDITKS